MLKCSTGTCKGKVVGGIREIVHDPLLADRTHWKLGEPVFYCKKHWGDTEELFAGKEIQSLTKEQLEYWGQNLTTVEGAS